MGSLLVDRSHGGLKVALLRIYILVEGGMAKPNPNEEIQIVIMHMFVAQNKENAP
jgi:hypothetical protein